MKEISKHILIILKVGCRSPRFGSFDVRQVRGGVNRWGSRSAREQNICSTFLLFADISQNDYHIVFLFEQDQIQNASAAIITIIVIYILIRTYNYAAFSLILELIDLRIRKTYYAYLFTLSHSHFFCVCSILKFCVVGPRFLLSHFFLN